MKNNLPYIPDNVGIPILGEPYCFNDCGLATFFLECQPDKLDALLDTYINQPSRGQFEYRCLGSNGRAITTMIVGAMTMDVRQPGGEYYGKERYSELSFWIPCYDSAAWRRGEFKMGLFLPFLFPDSFSALATGREMFGFRKQTAAFRYPGGQMAWWKPQFTATVTGFKDAGPGNVAQAYDFVSLSNGGGDSGIADLVGDVIWRDKVAAGAGLIEHFFGTHWEAAATGEKLVPVLNDFLANCPALFLKQFPSIDGPQEAEVRSIAAAPIRLLDIGGIIPWIDLKTGALKRFNLRFERLASHPIVETLGLAPVDSDGDAQIVSATGCWMDINFQLETGKTLLQVAPRKKKIAVLGGGIGSLAAVYGITSTPGWQDKYEITLYQMGWRLGGKGASGRNRRIGDRIEEHGLHIWFGYYENAFRVIRECYAELARPANAPLASWDMAFKPQSTILVEEYVKDAWQNWPLVFLPNSEVPGEGMPRDDHPSILFGHLRTTMDWLDKELVNYLKQAGSLGVNLLSNPVAQLLMQWKPVRPAAQKLADAALDALPASNVDGGVERFFAVFRTLYGIFPEPAQADRSLASNLSEGDTGHWQDVIDEFLALIQQTLAPLGEVFESIRRILTVAELALTIAKGVLVDGVLWYGYARINQYDFVEWLVRNGCSAGVANSALVRAFYDLYFGFPNGENQIIGDGVAIGGDVSAGELLHSYVLIVTCYKGAVMWKMQAGMGDTVMTPLYQVLKQRGVHFKFFHQVTDIRLDADKSAIGTIEIDEQVAVKAGGGEYNPLYDVKNLACWPSEPLYEQLEKGWELREQGIDFESPSSTREPFRRKTLKLGEDFDQVVLGISVAALPALTAELRSENAAWDTMLKQANTTRTQAMQLWLNVNLEETGWPLASPILDAYGEPFNTWAAMDQTLDKENWPQNALPFGIAYFCNNMKEGGPDNQAEQTQLVKERARKWLDHYTGHLWPFATRQDNPNGLDWSKLVDIENRDGEARLDGQYFRANVSPSERYVCNARDTNQYRLTADGSGFSNLFLTGDWIDNGSLNLGCVESTVIAGLQAAQALTGQPLAISRDGNFSA